MGIELGGFSRVLRGLDLPYLCCRPLVTVSTLASAPWSYTRQVPQGVTGLFWAESLVLVVWAYSRKRLKCPGHKLGSLSVISRSSKGLCSWFKFQCFQLNGQKLCAREKPAAVSHWPPGRWGSESSIGNKMLRSGLQKLPNMSDLHPIF